MMWDHMGGWDWMSFGLLHMLLFWALIILAIVALVKWLRSPEIGGPREKTALEILEERYARGEIDREEYQQKRQILSVDRAKKGLMGKPTGTEGG